MMKGTDLSDLSDSLSGTNVYSISISNNLINLSGHNNLGKINTNDNESINSNIFSNNYSSTSITKSDRSYWSDTTDSDSIKCYYCDSRFTTKEEHLRHSVNSNPRKVAQSEGKLLDILGIQIKEIQRNKTDCLILMILMGKYFFQLI